MSERTCPYCALWMRDQGCAFDRRTQGEGRVRDRKEANKIIVGGDTIVAWDEKGKYISANELHTWAYRRLESWPEMLEALDRVIPVLLDARHDMTSRGPGNYDEDTVMDINEALENIRKAREGVK